MSFVYMQTNKMRTDSLLAHLIAQTRQNVELLIELNHISPANGREILALLPSTTDNLADTPLEKARALWDYHEDPNDLSFRAGDIIEIVAETNHDWWTGRLDGREGLFPSNYVEKLKDESYPPANYSYQPPAPPPAHGPPYSAYPGPPPGPPPPQPSPYPGNGPFPSYASPPPPPPQAQPSKLSTMVVQGAASGVGWGAGTAVGSGIINAIF